MCKVQEILEIISTSPFIFSACIQSTWTNLLGSRRCLCDLLKVVDILNACNALVKTYDFMVGVQVKWSRERGMLIWRDLEISDLQWVRC